ncbi:phosphoglycerate kinase [Amorphus sp. 3PC139-8]|uniref:phosphoglycerate kinase n=1 Tax=Amorphus sp. 3PC139-8 TaxID=2735676 RepID=UPI00345DCE56
MGLDMYAFATDQQIADEVDFSAEGATEIFYWRKHPNLHGWMERLYSEKGGASPVFNCVNVQLTAADIDRLEADIKAGALPHTEGFFFGASNGSETEGDLTFVAKARELIEAGATVFYTSWW